MYKPDYRSRRHSGPTRSGSFGAARRTFNSSSRSRRGDRFSQKLEQSLYISKPEETENSEVIGEYTPQNSFNDFNLHPILSKNIINVKYQTPTKIQDETIPRIINGNDILGIGRTGSGKTGAFLIPMIDKVMKRPGDRVLILSPTRELAEQTFEEFKKLSRNTGLKIALVIGGVGYRDQIRLLRDRAQFVVATPGRLIDLEKKNYVRLSEFNNLVLDEVDRMLDMGFMEDIKYISGRLAPQKQSLFFSATMSIKEETLANTLLKNPIKVESHTQCPLKTIHQDVVKVRNDSSKITALQDILQKGEFTKVLVFSRTKHGADNISNELNKNGIKADSLHGDKSQNNRSKIMAKFKQDEIKVLIATDVAARGIDVPNITLVINYDEPATYNDYIHRIGRTGRIGRVGTALTFVIDRKY